MVLVKLFPTEIRALHLRIPSEEFMIEWKECVDNKKRDLTKILTMLEPYVEHWFNLLTDEEYPRDIQLATLYQRLVERDGLDFYLVRLWAASIDLKNELRYIAIETLRSTAYYPSYARPQGAEYVFAFLYKDILRRQIKRQLHLEEVVFTDDETILDSESIEPTEPDSMLWQQLPTDRWNKYLLYLIINGFTTLEIANIIHLPRETFYYEDKDLWEQIKTLWQLEAQ